MIHNGGTNATSVMFESLLKFSYLPVNVFVGVGRDISYKRDDIALTALPASLGAMQLLSGGCDCARRLEETFGLQYAAALRSAKGALESASSDILFSNLRHFLNGLWFAGYRWIVRCCS
jgi:hypothetical protein